MRCFRYMPVSAFCRRAMLLWVFGFSMLAVKAQVPFICQDQFFITLLRNDFSSLDEVVIDARTLNVTFQTINTRLRFQVNSAGYRSVDNLIYCLDPINRNLIQIDATGNARNLANLPIRRDLAYFAGDVTPDGRFLVLIGTLIVNNVEFATELVKVNLEDPSYPIETVGMNSVVHILDIAFQPRTGDLYGYDSNARRLVRIDINTGAVQTPFASNTAPATTGSLFFDAYERLFAYGSLTPQGNQNTLYEIDITTGVARQRTTGPQAVSSDGCSCPYTVRLSKSVTPKISPACSEVEYTLTLVNSSRRPQLNLRLVDALPPGFTFVSMLPNSLGGTLRTRPGDPVFNLEGFDLPGGTTEVKIVVNTGAVRPGVYANQAVLFNLPRGLGSTRVSDNLETLVEDDSTKITIVGLPFRTLNTQAAICNEASNVQLNAQPFTNNLVGGVRYRWADGSTNATFSAPTPGNYTVQLLYGCDTARLIFEVQRTNIDVTLRQDQFAIGLGDSVDLRSTVRNSGRITRYQWRDPQPGSLRCTNCPNPVGRPFNDLTYTLVVENELLCRDSVTAKVTVDRTKSIYFPNVFKPESGEANGFFYPSGPNFASIGQLQVFSRWGELMFEARDAALNSPVNGWDGTYRGRQMQPGVYVWRAEIVLVDGLKFEYFGDVTLIR
jgi:gliding motility-associated-like protein